MGSMRRLPQRDRSGRTFEWTVATVDVYHDGIESTLYAGAGSWREAVDQAA